MTVEEAVLLDAHNAPAEQREEAIQVLLDAAAGAMRDGGRLAEAMTLAHEAIRRGGAHKFMVTQVERRGDAA